jgi:hypothetical protein
MARRIFTTYGQVARAGLTTTRLGRLQGVGFVLNQMQMFERGVLGAARTGLRRAAYFLLRESKLIVPVDTGALKASGRVMDQNRLGLPIQIDQYSVYVVYTVYYALYVHEMVHIRRRNGKLPKFVEIPLRLYHRQMIAIVDATIFQRTGQIGAVWIV